MSLEDDFQDAQSSIKQLQRAPEVDELLDLYSLYKQAVAGDATGPSPGAFDFKARAKHDAWMRLKGMTRDAAREAYIELVSTLTAKYATPAKSG